MNSALLTTIATGIFSIIITLITVWSKHHLETEKKEKQRKKEEQLTSDDVNSMMEIQNFLDGLISRWEFDRAAIYQFHNGGKFFNGIAMKKFSVTFEAISAGIERVKESNQNIFVTEHPCLMKHMNEKDFFFVNGDNPALDYMREKIEEQGILQLVTVPMRSLNGSLLGFVQFSTIKHPIEITKDMEHDLTESVLRISGYIMD
jgi:hypothetical protein